MTLRKSLFLAALVLASCTKKESAPAESAAPVAPAPEAKVEPQKKAEAPAPEAQPAAEAKIDCAKLLPADVVEKAFPGTALAPPNGSTDCTLTSKTDSMPYATVAYSCGGSNETPEGMKAGLGAMSGAKELTGVGKFAMQVSIASMTQIHAIDDDTPCTAVVTYTGKPPADTTAPVKQVLSALTDAALK